MRLQDLILSMINPHVAGMQVDNIVFEVDSRMQIQIRVLDGGVIQPMSVSLIPSTLRKLEAQIEACRRFRTLCSLEGAKLLLQSLVNGTIRVTVMAEGNRSESCVYTQLGSPPVYGKSRLNKVPAVLGESTVPVKDLLGLAKLPDGELAVVVRKAAEVLKSVES